MNKFTLGKNLIEKNIIFNNIKIMPTICLVDKELPKWDLSNTLIFKLIDNNLLISNFHINLNYWFQLKNKEFGYLLYNASKIIVPDNSYIYLFDEDLWDKIIFYREQINLPEVAEQIYVSNTIKHVKKQIIKKFNLVEYNDIHKPAFFFGVYNVDDLQVINKHKSNKYVIFGGSDLDYTLFHTKTIIPKLIKHNIDKYYIISDNLYQRAISLGFDKKNLVNINLDLTQDTIPLKFYGKKIFIYDGCFKTGQMYRKELAQNIIDNLSIKFDVIFSSNLSLDYTQMNDIYKQCFIGIRLTEKDGNANTVLEMRNLGIPVIYNGGGVNAISYNDNDDIKNKIIDWYNIIKELDLFDY